MNGLLPTSEELSDQFSLMVEKLLPAAGYTVRSNAGSSDKFYKHCGVSYFVKIQFFKSNFADLSLVRSIIADFLADHASGKHRLLYITNGRLPKSLKTELFNELLIDVWEQDDLFTHLKRASPELTDKYEDILKYARQATQSTDFNIDMAPARPFLKNKTAPITNPEILIEQLKEVRYDKDTNQLSVAIVNFLFEKDLSLVNRKELSDQDSNFVHLAVINAANDLWKSIATWYRSRFLIIKALENKTVNKDGEIEKLVDMLHPAAFKSVAIILAEQPLTSRQNNILQKALINEGKLIIPLTYDALIEMIRLKVNFRSPNDYLSDKLDEILLEPSF